MFWVCLVANFINRRVVDGFLLIGNNLGIRSRKKHVLMWLENQSLYKPFKMAGTARRVGKLEPVEPACNIVCVRFLWV